MSPPPASATPTRRNRSQQRERILAWLRATDTHPSAAQVYEALLPEMPTLSLGTVYRNLDVLVAEGALDEVPCATGAARYDGNVEPHHHFNCDGCGRILDVALPVPRGLAKRLAGEHGLHSQRMRMTFFGLCPDCERDASIGSNPERERLERNTRRERNG